MVVYGILNYEDGIFSRQAQQQHNAYLRVDAYALIHEQASYDSAEYGRRHSNDHSERVGPALILCSENQHGHDQCENQYG